MDKLKIAVLFGGLSSEHEVSLQSAHAVITHLDKNRYDAILLGITPGGQWFHFTGEISRIRDNTWCNPSDCTKAVISPDRKVHGMLRFESDETRAVWLDAAFPVMHGKNGEDGTIQGLLELAGIPLVGCGTLCSAICMDKDKAHKLVNSAGVRAPQSFVINEKSDMSQALSQAEILGYPLFVKPVKSGSSLGISHVLNKTEFPFAVKSALIHDSDVIVEENIPGFEVHCAVLGKDEPLTGELAEIELPGGFFDYDKKYTGEPYSLHIPARIDAKKSEEIKEAAKIIYKTLGCSGFARVDMFLTPDGDIVFNEVNTIPGFTDRSHFPLMLKSVGITFEQMLDIIIREAVNRSIPSYF